METITVKNVNSLVGKTIKWGAPSYPANAPYGGVAKIISVENEKIISETIKGDDISFAFLDKTNKGTLLDDNYCYSDAGRYLSVIEEL